jgi:hypothetical protein
MKDEDVADIIALGDEKLTSTLFKVRATAKNQDNKPAPDKK